jgi:hypothetical protein
MTEDIEFPPPGLDGTYRGTCTVCLRGTDTGIAFFGEAEWVAAGMKVLGIPLEQAAVMISDVTGCGRGKVPAGRFQIVVRVCRDCVRASGTLLRVGLIPDRIPCYPQDWDYNDGESQN